MTDQEYMRRAIALAKKGKGKVNPNPLVGAVIVKDDKIIAEGYHEKYGDLHAERNAFSHLKNKEDAKGATMYVTLEPCCHHGKQPPCTEAVIEHGIKKIFVGSDDPNELVAGKGIEILRNAGVEVVTQFLKEECDSINPVFFHYITKKTPFVLMKYAMTMDGKIATHTGHSQWISGEESRARVQETRNELKGIMVGIGTVLADDPQLTCRIEGGRNPIRIVCDSKLRIPLDSKLVKTAKEVETIVATTVAADTEKKKELEKASVVVLEIKEKNGQVDLKDLMLKLGERQIDGILLEGGGTLNYRAICEGIVNRIEAYIAPKIFGGAGKFSPVGGEGVALAGDAFSWKMTGCEKVGEDILLTYDKA